MKKITFLVMAMLAFCWQGYAQTSTLYFTAIDNGCCDTEKWVSITTGPDGAGTVIFAQGDGTYGNAQGLLTDAMFTVNDGATYYINAYDRYDDTWDGDTYEIRSAPGGGGFLVANNGGASPDDGNDEDASSAWGDTQEQELEVSEAFSYTPPTCTPSVVDSETVVPDCGNSQFSVDVVISDAGDAGTVIDDGTTTYPVAVGTVTVGPYADGSTVTLDIVNLDSACDFSLGDFSNTCPANQDTCATADSITPGTYTTTINQGTGGGQGDTVTTRDAAWYAFTAAGDGTIDVSSCLGGADTRLYIFDSCGGVAIADNDDECDLGTGSAFASEITGLSVVSGTTYYIEWDDRWSAGPFDWTLTYTPPPPPANDTCATAIALSCFGSESGNSDLATDDDGVDGADVWFTFDSSTTLVGESITFASCGSGYDTTMTVYDSCGGTELDFNDDSCGLQSEVTVTSDATTVYVIKIEGFNGATGDYTFTINCPLPTPPTTVGVLDLSGCVDLDTYTDTYDASVSSVIWLELTYDGGCVEATVDTEGSDFDTEIGLYADTGVLIGNDDDGGTGLLSSFTEQGLPAGTYYVAAGGFNTTFNTDFDVTSTSTAAGSLVVNASTPTPPPPTSIATLNLTGCSDSDTYSTAYDGTVDGVVWLELTYDGLCSEATFDTVASDFDTEIGLYDSNGFLVANNDDIGGGNVQSEITEVGLVAGTYYIAIGGFNTIFNDGFDATTTSTRTGNLEFLASTPALSCNPVIIDSSTVVETCNPDGTGTFTVDIVVSDAGDAGSDFDDGTNTYPVVAGTVVAGPYNSGDSVTIEVVAVDSACDTTVGTFSFTCPQPPPANDECADAISLTVNPDYECGAVTAGTVFNATDSGADDATCFGTPDDDVWYSFTATAESHRVSLINITGSTSDMYMTFYDATAGCGSLGASIACSDPQTANLTGLNIGTTYFLQVYTWTSTPGQTSAFDVCVGTPPPPSPAPACGENFYDTGGSSSDYENNEDYTVTICPDNSGDVVTATFNSFVVEGRGADNCWDWLYIYDGDDTSGTPITPSSLGLGAGTSGFCYESPTDGTADLVGQAIEASGATGCLTFRFTSDSSATRTGWDATISCATLGTDDFNMNELFSYYPNPVTNTLNLKGHNTINNVLVYNMLGQEVLRATPNAANSELDMSGLQTGAYFVKVTIGGSTKTIRVLKN